MIFAETKDLPYSITEAIKRQASIYNDAVAIHLDQAGKFDHQISVTALNKSPRQLQLFRRHSKEIVIDPWDRLHLLDGSIFHYILESHPDPNALVERRFGTKIKYKGQVIYIHGAADLFYPDSCWLLDYKRISCVSLQFPKDDYIFQLNLLKWIIERQQGENLKVNRISNLFSVKDWKKSEARKFKPGYPQKPIFYKDYDIWDKATMERILVDRIKRHIDAASVADNDLPYCTDEERWQRNKYRVFGKKKNGEWSKASKGTYSSQEEADSEGAELGEFMVTEVTGRPTKCIDFCDCCIFCNQRQNEIKLAKESEDESLSDETEY